MQHIYKKLNRWQQAAILVVASFIAAMLFGALSVGAVPYMPAVGGTGSTTLSGILIGNGTAAVNTLTIGSNLTLSGTTLSATGGGGAFPFTPRSYGNSTSTTIGFLNGLFSNGSTTVSSLGSGLTGANNGLLYGVSTSSLNASITGNAATVTNGIYTTDTGTVTNTMLAGSIANNKLTNSSVTVNGTVFNLGDSKTITAASSSLLGDTNTFSGTDTFNNLITGSISGNAGTVTNGVYTTTFNGLFDNRLSASSSISGIATLPNLSSINTYSGLVAGNTGKLYQVSTTSMNASITGNAGTATKLLNARTINGISFDGTGNIVVASTTLLGDTNTFSGTNAFAALSLTNGTSTGSFYVTGPFASTTKFFANGLTSCSGASNALTWSAGGFGCNSITAGSAASSTLLSDFNTFSGLNAFTNVGTTTFAGAIGYGTTNPWVFATSTVVCLYPEICQYQADPTNSSAAIQKAVNNLSSMGGGTVYIKHGTYKLNPTTVNGISYGILGASNVTLIGEGNATVLQPTTSGMNAIRASSTMYASFQNFEIDGSNESGSVFNSDYGIRIKNSSDTTVNNVTERNMNGFAVFVDSDTAGSSTNTTITNNNLQCNALQDCIGGGPSQTTFETSTTTNVIISNNVIQQKTFTGSVENVSADTNCIDMVAVQDVQFTNNTCYGNLVFGSEQVPNQYSQISGNIVDSPLGPTKTSGDIVVITNGTGFTTLPSNLSIINNTVRSGKILVQGSGSNVNNDIIVSNNNVTTATSTAENYNTLPLHGIYLDTTANVMVQGNIVQAFSAVSTSTGIFATNSTNVTVSDNIIKDFAGVGGTCVNLNSGSGNSTQLNTYTNCTTNESGVTNSLQFTSGGFLGIGTSTPGTALSVVGNAFITGITNLARLVISGISAAFTPSVEGEIGIDTTDNQFKFFSGGAVRVLTPQKQLSFTYSTTTAWTGTTTLQLGPTVFNETWQSVKCYTNVGTLNTSFLNGANRMNMFNASTTMGTTTLSTNNAIPQSTKRSVDIGTPASSPTVISCTVIKTTDPT